MLHIFTGKLGLDQIGMPFAFIFRFLFDICKFMVYLEKEVS